VALGHLAEEQAALRRVATLAAENAAPAVILDAVAQEMQALLDADQVLLVRFEPGEEILVQAYRGVDGAPDLVGLRLSEGDSATALVRETKRPARFEGYDRASGGIAELAREAGLRSSVSVPIIVGGLPWGAITASWTREGSPPEDTESRMVEFGELLVTAIANAESREELARLAEEQAALRRVATLAAGETSPEELLGAVTEEAARVLETEAVGMLRFEQDGAATLVAQSRTPWDPPPLGTRFELDGENVVAWVRRTGRAARMDDWSDASGAVSAMAQVLGVRSTVATPIVVEGELWGAMIAATGQPEPLPADTESRLVEFTELVATAVASSESREALARLADEQAALRKVAVLVAQQPSPDEVFTAVTEAVAPLLGADLTAMHVFAEDGFAMTIAGWSAEGPMLPLGTRLPLDNDSAAARIFQTGAAARIDSYIEVEGETAGVARGLGLRSTVGAPILVEGRLWGALMAATRGREPLPLDAEPRIAAFTELVATAVANAESRSALALLADEQAALRRVATLVAQGVPSSGLFSAVTKEVARVFASVDPSLVATVIRFDPGPESVLVGASRAYEREPVGSRWTPKDLYVSTRVLDTGRAARVDEADLDAAGGADADVLRLRGFLHQVGSPVVVEGRLWGAMTLNSTEELPPDVDRRLVSFTELVATAIANAESQSELAASRRRIVAASDDARRRIERDLHDGIQQQLVSVGMELGGVEASLPADSEVRTQLAAVANALRSAIDDLREISRGIHPALLAHGGLGAALRTLARRSPVPVQLNAAVEGRLPERVEVAAYYVVSEALTNVAKHARASEVGIEVAARNGVLDLSIRDDGIGGADARSGTGLIGLKDRVEALGGRIAVESVPDRGTSLFVTLPLALPVATGTEESDSV
jgi:signal transduction histidine kinase